MNNPIRIVAASLAFSRWAFADAIRDGAGHFRPIFWSALILIALIGVPKVAAQNIMHVPSPSDNKAAPKSELAAEPSGSETPQTLRVVIALALGAAVVAVVCMPSRKGGGDER